jgi:hypothetical protein
MITAHVETLRDTMEELKAHFDEHWRALALNQDKVPLDPDYGHYFERENLGQVMLVVLRETGRVVAYFVGFLAPALHYQSCYTLTMDIFWLSPAYRDEDSLSKLEASMLATQLFEAVLEEAQRRHVKRAWFGTKVHSDVGRVFEELGMVDTDHYYSKWLGD